MDRKRRKLTLEKVITELQQVKEERARDKINFKAEKCELESKIDKYKEQCTELQSENERLQKYLEDLASANINVEENSPINLCHSVLTRQITKVNESNDDALDINSLPNEIILNVFGYLEQNQLGQIARVCRRWNVLTKSPFLWKNVNVKISPSHGCQTTVAESFINGLPSCVTTVRLDFMEYRRWVGTLEFAELCVKLQEKCPHLEELMLTNSRLSNSLPAVLNISSQVLQDVKNLIFHHSTFRCNSSTDECFGISKIKIFELFNCYFDYSSKSPFSKMPHLRQLHLFHSMVPDSWFEGDTSFLNQLHVLNVGRTLINSSIFSTIQNHCHNLKELYLCSAFVQDIDLNFNNSTFPHLKIICLSLTPVTCKGVVSLIQSCPSLHSVYVSEYVAVIFAVHPFAVANRWKSGIVKTIISNHNHNVDYLDI